MLGNADASVSMRAQAAMALTELAPVRGRAIGSEALLASLRRLDEGARKDVLALFVERAIERLRQAPAGKGDAQYALKDTAQMLLVTDHQLNKPLLSDEAQRTQLKQALTDWIMADFSNRRSSRRQLYGVKSLFAVLGPEAGEKLLGLQSRNIGDAARIIDIIAPFKDPKLRDKAGSWLVKLGREVAAPSWREQKKPAMMEANRSTQFEPTAEQLQKQLRAYQDEALARLLTAGRKLSSKAVLAFARELADDETRSERLRRQALAVAEGRERSEDSAGIGSLTPSPTLGGLLAEASALSSASPAPAASTGSAEPSGSGSTSAPRGDVMVGGAGVAGGKIANASTVVARMRGRFRRCYQRLLESRPEAQGSVVLVARIGPHGEVQGVGGGGGALAPMVACLKAVVASGAFSPPEGGRAVVSIPITFVKQDR